jgi:serine-type D-Ala-D-Ala carboxypeptidase
MTDLLYKEQIRGNPSMHLHKTHGLMIQALEDRLFTAGLLLVINNGKEIFHEPYGSVGGPGTAPVTRDTLFDLASLTKVLATTPSWMILAQEQPRILDESIVRWFTDCPRDKRAITPRHLLAHASGLPAWRPYYLFNWSEPVVPSLCQRILHEPLEYPTGRGWRYSDLGFILLASALQLETGLRLDRFALQRIYEPLELVGHLMFLPVGNEHRTALTRPGEEPGVVNDLNTRVLGGVSGHAGLFGTGAGVAALAAATIASLKTDRGFLDSWVVKKFCTRAGFTSDSTRALGFDTPSLADSSSGRFFPQESLGHTGFTGTSLWMDSERELIVVLLTNRVFMGEADQRLKSFRPLLHDAVMEGLG